VPLQQPRGRRQAHDAAAQHRHVRRRRLVGVLALLHSLPQLDALRVALHAAVIAVAAVFAPRLPDVRCSPHSPCGSRALRALRLRRRTNDCGACDVRRRRWRLRPSAVSSSARRLSLTPARRAPALGRRAAASRVRHGVGARERRRRAASHSHTSDATGCVRQHK